MLVIPLTVTVLMVLCTIMLGVRVTLGGAGGGEGGGGLDGQPLVAMVPPLLGNTNAPLMLV